MIFRVILLTCLASLVANQPLRENASGKSEEDCYILEKLVELSKSVGLLKHRVHRYDVQLNKNWSQFIKKMIKEYSEELKSMDPERIDELFNVTNAKDASNLTIFLLEFEIGGPKIFRPPTSDWTWKDQGSKKNIPFKKGTKGFMEEARPILTLKEHDIDVEFILGPKFSETQDVNVEYFDTGKPKDKKNRKFRLSNPTLETIVKPEYQKIIYSIFLHTTDLGGIPADTQKKLYEVSEIIRELVRILGRNINDGKPKVGLNYGYKSDEYAISLQDDSVLGFLNRWAKPTGDHSATINLFDAVKKLVKDPRALRTFKPAPHNSHELEAYGKEKDIFIVDKFYDSNDLSGHQFQERNKNQDEKLSKSLKNRLNEILEKVEKEGVDENEIHNLEKWMKDLMKKDFEKHRKEKGTKFAFHPSDQHFAYRSRVNFKPLYESHGPPFGVGREVKDMDILSTLQTKPDCETKPGPEPESLTEPSCETEPEPKKKTDLTDAPVEEVSCEPEPLTEPEPEQLTETEPEPLTEPEPEKKTDLTDAPVEEVSCEPEPLTKPEP